MKFMQGKNGEIHVGENVVTRSEYNKAETTWKEKVQVPVTKKEKQERCVTCAETGKRTVLDVVEVDVPVTEKKKIKETVKEIQMQADKDGKPMYKDKVITRTVEEVVTKEVLVSKRYNKYDGFTIIPDDAVEISEKEYNKILEKELNRE